MYLYNFIIQNKDLLKIFYALVVALICAVIVIRTDKIFRISFHQGVRYFRNAFLFYGIAFTIRFITFVASFFTHVRFEYLSIARTIFEFFLIMAGFFLLYSLLWRRFELKGQVEHPSSLFNSKILIFYAIAVLIAALDFIWQTFIFMFSSQIILFIFASGISLSKYLRGGDRRKFLKLYFVAMVLSLVAWILNAIAAIIFQWNQGILMNIYLINLIIFLLFLYGVIKVTRGGNTRG